MVLQFTRQAGKWYAVVCCQVEKLEKTDDGVTAGVDRNAGQVAVVDSIGNDNIHHMPDLAKKEAGLNRYRLKLQRQVKGSNRIYKIKLKIKKEHRNRSGIRGNWQH